MQEEINGIPALGCYPVTLRALCHGKFQEGKEGKEDLKASWARAGECVAGGLH